MSKTGLLAIGCTVALASMAVAAGDPLAGLALDDVQGHTRVLDDLRGSPVLLVIADRRASRQADEWGARLAAEDLALAPSRSPGRITCLSIADLRGVPDYARDEARERIREREAARGESERRRCSTLLLDWKGHLAEAYSSTRGEALVVLLSEEHRPFHFARGAPTAAAVVRLRAEIEAVTPR